MSICAFSLKPRRVITPDGEGELIGVDSKDNPQMAVVMVKVEGKKLPVAKNYRIEELQEVEK